MNKLIIASAAAVLMMGISGSALAAMSAADCQSFFQRADINKDGSLQADEAKVFLDAMNQAQVKPKDASSVTQDEFLMACQKDAFAKIDPATIGTGQSTASTTTEQPAASTDQSASGEQTTTATTETTDQSATQPSTTDQTASTTEPTTMDQAAEQPAEQALAIPAAIMASDFIGSTVYSGSNETIGEVKDVVLSDSEGQTQVIIDVGDKDVAVELSHLKIAATTDGMKVALDATKADLESLPEFTKQ